MVVFRRQEGRQNGGLWKAGRQTKCWSLEGRQTKWWSLEGRQTKWWSLYGKGGRENGGLGRLVEDNWQAGEGS